MPAISNFHMSVIHDDSRRALEKQVRAAYRPSKHAAAVPKSNKALDTLSLFVIRVQMFLYKLVPGWQIQSFGLHCACQAHVPQPIISRAADVIAHLQVCPPPHTSIAQCLQMKYVFRSS